MLYILHFRKCHTNYNNVVIFSTFSILEKEKDKIRRMVEKVLLQEIQAKRLAAERKSRVRQQPQPTKVEESYSDQYSDDFQAEEDYDEDV